MAVCGDIIILYVWLRDCALGVGLCMERCGYVIVLYGYRSVCGGRCELCRIVAVCLKNKPPLFHLGLLPLPLDHPLLTWWNTM
jgi:hypothetical protein